MTTPKANDKIEGKTASPYNEDGLRTIYDTHDHPDPVALVHPSVLRGLVVSTPLLTERRDIVVRYLARLLQATHWAREHRDETIALIARDFRLAPAALAQAYDDVSAGVQIDLDATKIAALRAQKDFLLKHGFIAQDFERWLEQFVDDWLHAPFDRFEITGGKVREL